MNLYCYGSRPSGLIAATLNLPIEHVRQGLCTLIQHNLVTFQSKGKNTNFPEYALVKERILYLLRYAKYLLQIKYLYGDEAEIIIEELLCQGQDSASNLILKTAKRLQEALGDAGKNVSLLLLHEKLGILASNMFIVRCEPLLESPDQTKAKIPSFIEDKKNLYTVPQLDMKALNGKFTSNVSDASDQNDASILWRVNYERFNEEIRNQIICRAAEKRIDDSAGELMKLLLQILRQNGYDGSTPTSAAVSVAEIKDVVHKHGQKPALKQHLDQYLKALAEDSSNFIVRAGDAGGGQYVLHLAKLFDSLAHATVDSLVLERFGSKALRLFRLTRTKGYVEQDQMQQLSMVPSKEAKLFTYRLVEQNFLQLRELRKVSNTAAPTKTFFVFHVDTYQVASKALEMSYKALHNACSRRKTKNPKNRWFLPDSKQLTAIAEICRKESEKAAFVENHFCRPRKAELFRVRKQLYTYVITEIKIKYLPPFALRSPLCARRVKSAPKKNGNPFNHSSSVSARSGSQGRSPVGASRSRDSLTPTGERDNPAFVATDSAPQVQVPLSVEVRFNVGRIIGDGNFAVVRECVEKRNGERFALKMIDKKRCQGKEVVLESEVQVLSRVRHPNIVKLFDVIDSDNLLCLVLELVEGGDLFDAIAAAGKFSEPEARRMTLDLVSALGYLHSSTLFIGT
nr:EOG090X04YD [Eulimnadia texana]